MQMRCGVDRKFRGWLSTADLKVGMALHSEVSGNTINIPFFQPPFVRIRFFQAPVNHSMIGGLVSTEERSREQIDLVALEADG